MTRRALALLRRGHELGAAEYRYKSLIYHLNDLFTRMKGSEFARKIDRRVLTTLEDALEHQIRPGLIQVREEYVQLCGFDWEDWVRLQNPGQPAVALVATDLHYKPYPSDPHAWLIGKALNAKGRPGGKSVQTRLAAGTTRVTVLSSATERS